MNYILGGEEQFKKLWVRILNVLESKVLLYVALVLLVLKIGVVAVNIPLPQNFFFADITKSTLISLLNQNREAQGLNSLTESDALNRAATLKAKDMVINDYFAHKSPTGITPWYWFGEAGYTYKYAGENLAVGFMDSPEVFNAWLNSPSHKANMINPNYKEVGTAVLSGFEGNSIIVVQLFGSPKIVTATPKPTPKIPPIITQTQKPIPAPTVPVIAKTEPKDAVTVDPAPQVLSAISENGVYSKPGDNVATSPYLKVLNFVIYGNTEGLQYVAYLLLLLIGGGLFVGIITGAEKLHKELIIQSLAVVGIVSLSLMVNQDLLIKIIPHQIII